MSNQNVTFATEKKGYDKGQVDSYRRMISEAYQEAYDENRALWGMYNKLLEESQELMVQERTGLYADIVAKRIVENARADAEEVKEEARKFIDEIFEEAIRIFSAEERRFENGFEDIRRIKQELYA